MPNKKTLGRKPEDKLKSGNIVDVHKISDEFDEAERSSVHRNGIFKIDAPFEKALDTILKAKPGEKRHNWVRGTV
jgi:hypothetical protein